MHYNWHRHYDPSLGRYTQPDPLGFVDGPSVYGYARNNPLRYADPEGREASALTKIIPGLCTFGLVKPTPLGEIACACAIGAAAYMMSPKPDACQQNSCMAGPTKDKRKSTEKSMKEATRGDVRIKAEKKPMIVVMT